MSELLPTRQAATLQTALLDYLTTTFALADADARAALTSFLEHSTDGIFKGPYVRTRLPFAAAPDGWQHALDVLPTGFTPYGHQAAAFERLASRDRRPLPTLVTTGTGSGKTEAFLFPILDHVLRARREGDTGTKALILYPMNALANDQAARLAHLITEAPAAGQTNPYAGVTAALYTGEDGPQRTKVSAEGLVSSREIIRSSPPDILLTNYKMLDHLLLRAEDAPLWALSADSLQYVVLDEFHSYDGAQGTDVAMLLRRLGLTLKSHWPARGSASDTHHEADWNRPLGKITPVGTSATLGDGQDSTSMVSFATEVFGQSFDGTCVVTESRVHAAEWFADAALPPGLEPATLTDTLISEIVAAFADAQAHEDGDALTRTLLASLFTASGEETDPHDVLAHASAAELLRWAKSLPLVRSLVERTREASHLEQLAEGLLPPTTQRSDDEGGLAFLTLVIAALSHLRAALDQSALSVEVHLWIRELTRIDRVASSAAAYTWSDDGTLLGRAGTDAVNRIETTFPALYCRHCGRSGWGVELATTGNHLTASDSTIRINHLARSGRFRALIHAPSEAQRAIAGATVEGLTWFNTQARDLTTALPDPDDADYRHGRLLAVLTHGGRDADDLSRNDTCPSCLQPDGIRFLGSAIATLLSVSLSTLFGDASLDGREKKALVFTDSVQDAAHRAGFVAARSHTFSLRSAMRDAFTDPDSDLNLPELADAIIARAGDDPFRRYRLLPTEFVHADDMSVFWRAETLRAVPRGVRDKVRRRLQFDLSLEFGLNSRVGRTLEATGTLGVHVDVGTPARMAAAARTVITGDDVQTLDGSDSVARDDATLVRWVRGVVEHLRTQGAIAHKWLEPYLRSDGNRWRLTGGRPRPGMPSFPKGRSHPAFPRVGGKRITDPLLDSVTDTQSWYARWTGRTLGVSPQHGSRLARGLLDRLAKDLLLGTVTTDSGGTVFTVPPTSVLVEPTHDRDLTGRRHRLNCTVCHAQTSGSIEAIDQLDGAPCLYVRCPGTLARTAVDPANFYRRLYTSADMRRIVAREHTSLLEAKTRLAYENGFKRGQNDPDAPNTLVATPTLEMGIDIGDLSAVFLASLPRSVASYLQRVGRAGRQTGNALNLVYVTGQGEFLPRLSDPSSLINGAVRPPSIYLSAEEILQRQYLAHLTDRFARDDVDVHHPRTARAALENTTAGSFLGDLIADAEAHASDRLGAFLGTFGDRLRPASVTTLQQWATPDAGPGTSALARQVLAASGRWAAQKETLEYRQAAIQTALPALQQAAAVAAASEDDKRSLQTAQAALKLVHAQLGEITGAYWIAALEEFGLLPNYTLLGDSATLDVSISWFDPDSAAWSSEATGVQRPTAQALREFAPGATFYAKGLEIEVDALDLGSDAEGIRVLAFCPDCGYAVDTQETGSDQKAGACPRCGSLALSDTGQRVPTVELRRASAAIRRDEALIDDRRDERTRAPFTIMETADIDPAFVKDPWFVDGFDFGAKYLTRVTVRWLNLGRRATAATPLALAGAVVPAARFRVCESCGHLDNSARSNSMDEHRPWCPHRKSPDEHTRTIALTRTLVTQGVVLPLPWTVTTGDAFALPSLQAALLLGLRDQFGGSPDHIGVMMVRDPNPRGTNPEALLLHDTVPGGTGYLADLATPGGLWALLRSAYETVRDCSCASDGRLACHRCLLPFTSPHTVDLVSRQSAERHLRALLTAGADDAPEPGVPVGWTVGHAPRSGPDATVESHLELRFRAAFLTLAKRLGATVTEEPGAWGNTLRLSLGSAQWKLEPQVQLGGVRPDFLLTSGRPGPRVAIFTDGFTFHATPKHNVIAADASKRATLRLQGDQVLAITARDLDAFEARGRAEPTWFDRRFLTVLTQRYGFSSPAASAMLGGPMEMLAGWLQQHRADDLGRFASATPLAFPRTLDLMVPERASLTEIADTLFDEAADMAADKNINAWWWRQGALGVLSRYRPGEAAGSPTGGVLVDVAVVLDNRPAAVSEPSFRQDWERWLQVSNLLAFRPPELTTTIGVLGETGTARVSSEARRSEVSARWREVLDALLVGDADDLANELSRRGVRAPDWVGEEVGAANIPVDFAWTGERVAVLLQADVRDVHDLEHEGWRVIQPDAEAITRALEEAHR